MRESNRIVLLDNAGCDAVEDDGSNILAQRVLPIEGGKLGESRRRKLVFESRDSGWLLIRREVFERFKDERSEVITLGEFLEIIDGGGAELEALKPELIKIDFTCDAGTLGLPSAEICMEDSMEFGSAGQGETDGKKAFADFEECFVKGRGNERSERFLTGHF